MDSIETPEVKRLYWNIGDVAREIGVSPSCIRFWLDQFGIHVHKSTRLNIRKFTASDVEKVKRIKYLVKERRFTLEGAKREFALC